jgi:hypothetical protein
MMKWSPTTSEVVASRLREQSVSNEASQPLGEGHIIMRGRVIGGRDMKKDCQAVGPPACHAGHSESSPQRSSVAGVVGSDEYL